MNVYDATECAYKNGYKQGKADAARDIFVDIKQNSQLHFHGAQNIVIMTETDFEAIKNKYLGEQT